MLIYLTGAYFQLNYMMESPTDEYSRAKSKPSREKKPYFETEEHRKAIRHSQMLMHGH